jgi:hypothetical protein
MKTLIKLPDEKLLLAFDFSAVKEIREGDTITGTPTVTITLVDGTESEAGALEVGDPTIVDSMVQMLVEGGELRAVHEFLCLVDTVAGWKLGAIGRLAIAKTG